MGRRDRHAGRFGRVECPSACYRALVAIAVIAFVARLTPLASAQTNADPHASTLAARDKEECIKNLKTIYAAIQAYQVDHKDLPNWLSDLVPQYLPDANALVCPLCRRTGKVEDAQLADPKMPSSYLFEFCPIYVDTGNRNGPVHTRREWKRRQMGLLGSVVPIVRCRHHDKVLNLAFDGQIYESPLFWEYLFTNRVSAAELTAARLFAGEVATPRPQAASRFPPRDPGAGPGLVDLTRHYNATLAESLPGQPNLNLSALPAGVRNFAGVEFDVRGIVQAGSQLLLDNRYPMQIKGIAVHQKCKHLHFLHAVRFATPADAGNQVASYFVHYAGNPAHLEIPIVCDRDLRDWLASPNEPPPPRELTVAWSANNPEPRAEGGSPRLFMATWTNLLPDTEIESIDFISNMSGPAPFLIAISTD